MRSVVLKVKPGHHYFCETLVGSRKNAVTLKT